LENAVARQVDIIFTLGGTGVGARDITPEVVTSMCDKIIPGIMEHIRMKYGATIPAALLSRSVAGIKNNTQIYTLPGSVKAVKEYLNEIVKILEHTIYMLRNIDH
jgi:molybdenum cofactor synthesis domain-containing protein